MYVIQCYDSSGILLGKYAGVRDGYPEVNHKILCSNRYKNREDAETVATLLKAWGEEDFTFRVAKVKG